MHRALIPLVLACLLSSDPARAADFCAYRNTNQLIWDDAVQPAVHAFFGDRRADLYQPDTSIAEQALDGLGGPPEAIRPLGEKLALAAACRAHSCIEKAALVVRCPQTIVAVGLLHYHCRESDGATTCDRSPSAAFYMRPDHDPAARTALEAWVADKADDPPISVHAVP